LEILMMMGYRGVASSALALAMLGWPLAASASTIDIQSVTGKWTATTGTPFNLNGLNTNHIQWGDPAGSPPNQSGYIFTGVAPPTQVFGTGTTFTLGTFEHDNAPIFAGTSITGATLQVTFKFDIDGGAQNTLVETYQFAHNETTNTGPGCCDDIVTALLNVGASQTFTIGAQQFVFNITGFQVGGVDFTQFSSPEGGSNQALLRGSFVDVTTVGVPGPIAGAGLPGLIAACGGLLALARRRRQFVV
jgi:hypothetical protein